MYGNQITYSSQIKNKNREGDLKEKEEPQGNVSKILFKSRNERKENKQHGMEKNYCWDDLAFESWYLLCIAGATTAKIDRFCFFGVTPNINDRKGTRDRLSE